MTESFADDYGAHIKRPAESGHNLNRFFPLIIAACGAILVAQHYTIGQITTTITSTVVTCSTIALLGAVMLIAQTHCTEHCTICFVTKCAKSGRADDYRKLFRLAHAITRPFEPISAMLTRKLGPPADWPTMPRGKFLMVLPFLLMVGLVAITWPGMVVMIIAPQPWGWLGFFALTALMYHSMVIHSQLERYCPWCSGGGSEDEKVDDPRPQPSGVAR